MASSVKNIVKVMNFHSLIRVDKAKRQAAKDRIVEKELRRTLASLINNVNLKMDDKMLKENPNGDILNIYIGNDYGFCGNFNHQLQAAILGDKQSKKILVGPEIMTRGFIYVKDSTEMIQKIKEISSDIIEKNTTPKFVDYNNIKNEIREQLSKYFYSETETKPMIIAVIQEV